MLCFLPSALLPSIAYLPKKNNLLGFIKRHYMAGKAVNCYRTTISVRTFYGFGEQRLGYLENRYHVSQQCFSRAWVLLHPQRHRFRQWLGVPQYAGLWLVQKRTDCLHPLTQLPQEWKSLRGTEKLSIRPLVSLTTKKGLLVLKASYDPVVLRGNLDTAHNKLHHAHSNKRLVEIRDENAWVVRKYPESSIASRLNFMMRHYVAKHNQTIICYKFSNWVLLIFPISRIIWLNLIRHCQSLETSLQHFMFPCDFIPKKIPPIPSIDN